MKRIYLIRHGQPEFPDGRSMCIGTTDLPMSAEGFRQARALALRLPPVTAVYSSPLIRCVQTAQALGLPVVPAAGLRELYAGEWDGLSFDTIRQRYPRLYAARGSDPTLLPPGAEPPQDGLARFRRTMEQLAEEAPGDCAVITHGGIAAAFLEEVTGKRYKPGYGEIVTLVWEQDRFYRQSNP